MSWWGRCGTLRGIAPTRRLIFRMAPGLNTPVAEVASAEVVKISGLLATYLVSKNIISLTQERFYKTGYFMSKHDFLSHLSCLMTSAISFSTTVLCGEDKSGLMYFLECSFNL